MAPAPPDLAVLVDVGSEAEGVAESIVRAGLTALEEEGIAQAEISVALMDDPDIREINSRHLGHEGPTDVISFGLWEEGEPVVGDIYIGAEQARRQSIEEGVPFEEELVRLTVHGVLHVLGWDHPDAVAERAPSPMYRRQEELVTLILKGAL